MKDKRIETRGRKPKLDNTLIESICKLISVAAPIKDACLAVGISETTYHSYISKGEDDSISSSIERKNSLYAKFLSETKKAEAKAKQALLEIIYNTAKSRVPNTWMAAAWLLERKWPAEFAKRIEVPLIENKILIALREEGKALIQSCITKDNGGIVIDNSLYNSNSNRLLSQGKSVTGRDSTVTSSDIP